MHEKVNTYFAITLIVIAGTSAAWIIIRTATTSTVAPVLPGTESSYTALQTSLTQ
ncbi:MAG: hypothetical protein ACHQU0_01245 [Candidatus Paceibacteria bacterium]